MDLNSGTSLEYIDHLEGEFLGGLLLNRPVVLVSTLTIVLLYKRIFCLESFGLCVGRICNSDTVTQHPLKGFSAQSVM